MKLRSVGPFAAALAIVACSSGTDRSPDPIGPSFACIAATAIAHLTDTATIGEARQSLLPLTTDTTLTDDQRSYFAEQLAALEGKPDEEPAEPILLDVPCNLT